ncbi:hypothetical protein J3R30DRAFT_1322915 [Lentinula aciculospora]|uniref:Mid2 domain-containing protein n=1 Tax=Lentinula aciculospora TaxID=153920 RepID=A0A9W9DTL8_9AGAR|nr:hypothetical protein J3R30DRAFT_1322915 [Lentinula aciculospora]
MTWILSGGDPTTFGLIEKDLNDRSISAIVAVHAGSSSSGTAEMTFMKTGQFVVQGISQLSLTPGATLNSIGGAPQIGVVEDTSLNNVQRQTPIVVTSTTFGIFTTSSFSTSSSSSLVSRVTETTAPRTTSNTTTRKEAVTTDVLSTPTSSTSSSPSSYKMTTTLTPIATSTVRTDTSSSMSTPTSSPDSSSSDGRGLSRKCKAIVLAVIGATVVLGTLLIMCIRKRRFIKQRRRIAVFRERLAQIPGFQGLGVRSTWSSSTEPTSHTSGIMGFQVDGNTTMLERDRREERSYRFASGSSSQIFF